MIAVLASSKGELVPAEQVPQAYRASIGWFAIGVGKVQASLNTHRIIGEFRPTGIIGTGTCGAVDPRMQVGDLVLASETVDYDLDLRRFGLDRGTTFDKDGNRIGTLRLDVSWFPPPASDMIFEGRRVWHQVRIGSADRFLVAADRQENPWIAGEMHIGAVDMESHAIAATAFATGIPVSIVRVVSDTHRGERPRSYASFLAHAAASVMRFVIQYSLPNEKSPTIL